MWGVFEVLSAVTAHLLDAVEHAASRRDVVALAGRLHSWAGPRIAGLCLHAKKLT